MEEPDPNGFYAGDYINVYSLPALLMGVALAYVYLQEGAP
jgi:hypothetical protein